MFRNPNRRRVTVNTGSKSLVQQDFKDEADINVLVRRFTDVDLMPGARDKMQATYGDFTNIPDFFEANLIVSEANEAFMALPATIREDFDNDPGKFLAWCSDPNNRDQMRELGLLLPKDDDSVVASLDTNEGDANDVIDDAPEGDSKEGTG